jgi:hypothetical protein
MRIDERIGVLFVHGIGEQKRFQHLDSEVRNFASAIAEQVRRKEPPGSVTVQITPGSSSAFQADRESWRCDRVAPVRILIRRKNSDGQDRCTAICCHEVWWADLDEPTTLWSQIRFWFWGLSVWWVAQCETDTTEGFERQMRGPTVGEAPPWLRSRLFFVATTFAIASGSLTLLNFLLKRLGFGYVLGTRTFVNYLGDVKLYREADRADRGPIYDLDQAPRFPIRRRMVAGVVDMATAGYDRWYIFAHSLGSVVAFNALMEPAHSLANYVDHHRWCRLLAQGLAGPGTTGKDWPDDLPQPPTDKPMKPRRPVWLEQNDVVHRQKLFAGLRGVLTYGSPLDKFAAIWSAIVPLNRMEPVFGPSCEWINVYDPTDPVAGQLDSFDPEPGDATPGGYGPIEGSYQPLQVKNFAYFSSLWLLLGHIRYMKYKPDRLGWMAHVLARWVQDAGSSFDELTQGHGRWLAQRPGWIKVLSAWRWFQWIGAFAIVTALTAGSISGVAWLAELAVLDRALSALDQWGPSWIVRPIAIVVLAALICLVCGGLRRIFLGREFRTAEELEANPAQSAGDDRTQMIAAAAEPVS